jgi:hypothetical protein
MSVSYLRRGARPGAGLAGGSARQGSRAQFDPARPADGIDINQVAREERAAAAARRAGEKARAARQRQLRREMQVAWLGLAAAALVTATIIVRGLIWLIG